MWLRNTAGLSGREVDQLAGLTNCRTGSLERGDIPNPRIHTVEKIAALFDVRLEWLLTGQGRAPTKRSLVKAVHARRVGIADRLMTKELDVERTDAVAINNLANDNFAAGLAKSGSAD